ncbi:hypothetical protein IJV79_01475 [bacterium]|nr:hypothetical protein [bacterium]
MKSKLFLSFLAVCIFALGANAAAFKTNAKTKRIPAGTKLQFQMLNNISTSYGQEGDAFNALLLSDQSSETSIVLPTGSIVRGTIREIRPARRLSRGAVLYLDFDHIVTPTGRQMPLSLGIYNRTDLTYDGGLNEIEGYGDMVKRNWDKRVDILKTATNWGVETGQDAFPGAVVVTAPVGAVGGYLGSFGYFYGKSIVDLFRKGPEVNIPKGTKLDVVLTQPVDVPIN